MEREEGLSGKANANAPLELHMLILTQSGSRQQSPQPLSHPASLMGAAQGEPGHDSQKRGVRKHEQWRETAGGFDAG